MLDCMKGRRGSPVRKLIGGPHHVARRKLTVGRTERQIRVA